jgi:putative FmdB family regulatory protein
MPLYDYKCSKCGYIFEVQQKISEEPLKHCPKCKGHIKRIISPAGIIFKGSGFHVTDYGRKAERKKEVKEKPKKEGKKSESKEVSK